MVSSPPPSSSSSSSFASGFSLTKGGMKDGVVRGESDGASASAWNFWRENVILEKEMTRKFVLSAKAAVGTGRGRLGSRERERVFERLGRCRNVLEKLTECVFYFV